MIWLRIAAWLLVAGGVVYLLAVGPMWAVVGLGIFAVVLFCTAEVDELRQHRRDRRRWRGWRDLARRRNDW